MRRAVLCGCALLGLLLGAAAHAQDEEDQVDNRITVMLSGGIGDFTGNLSSQTQAGPTWGVIVGLQPLRAVGVELGYKGSRNAVHNTDGALVRNGLDALIKFSPPSMTQLRPFVGSGMGISHVSVSGTGPFTDDTLEEVPIAAGVEFLGTDVTAGFRATYRFLIDDQLATGESSPGGLFDAAFTVGGRF